MFYIPLSVYNLIQFIMNFLIIFSYLGGGGGGGGGGGMINSISELKSSN